MIEVAVKGIILDESNRILVLKRSKEEDVFKNLWDIPGGKIEFGEDLKQALKREIKEEAGIEVDVLFPLNTWSFFRNENTYVVGITFLCRPRSTDVNLSKEHKSYKWIHERDLDQLEMNENLRQELRLFFRRLDVLLSVANSE